MKLVLLLIARALLILKLTYKLRNRYQVAKLIERAQELTKLLNRICLIWLLRSCSLSRLTLHLAETAKKILRKSQPL